MATYTQTYTFADGNTASGDNVNSEIVDLGSSVNDIVDAQVNSSAAIAVSKLALSAGEGIDLSGGGVISGEDATITNKGIASFPTAMFTVTAGAVTIKDASTTVKGKASFNTNHFTTSSGAISVKGTGSLWLDWDNVWTDSVHSHTSAGEYGNLDWDTCWSDAVHSHASAAEGGSALTPASVTASGNIISSGGYLRADGDISARDGGDLYAYSAGNDKHVRIYHSDTDGYIVVSGGVLQMDNMTSIRPTNNLGQSLGQASWSWNEVHYHTLHAHSLVETGNEIEMADGSKVSNTEALSGIGVIFS